MAANNYFGFAHGTQYGAQPTATAYAPAPAQATYVQQAPQAYAATPVPRGQTYEAYPSAPAATQYTYTTRSQGFSIQAPMYDPGKTAYYAPAAQAAPPTAVYSVAESQYQPAYHTVAPAQAGAAVPVVAKAYASYPNQQARQPTMVKQQLQQSSVGGFSSNTSAASSSYDAALYSAATNYYQQQQGSKTVSPAWQNKKPYIKKPIRQPPKQPQLHYCEICKISCAGPQTYREHLEGQKHKKKEAAAKTGAPSSGPVSRGSLNQLRCELCDVTCTGSDAYAAHIRGAKHQKVVKLHTKLGKPIPSTEPTVLGTGQSSSSSSTTTTPTTTPKTGTTGPGVNKPKSATTATTSAATKKVYATPKINFIGSGTLKTTGMVSKEEAKSPELKTSDGRDLRDVPSITTPEVEDTQLFPGEKEISPVGHEYIEEVQNEFGKVVSFHCKLCECKFNDPNAKLMHMKGRRHRLQYKKKVDPSLAVDIKPSMRMRKLQEDKMRRTHAKVEFMRRREAEERWREELRYMMAYEQPAYHYGGFGGPYKRPDSIDDRHVLAKHVQIYPTDEELQAVQNIVTSCEKSLKQVSDIIAEADFTGTEKSKDDKDTKTDKSDQTAKEAKPEDSTSENHSETSNDKEGSLFDLSKDTTPRALKGVMRVGVLAKGLLLRGDLNVHLVVLCAEKPTRTLLERVTDHLPKQLSMNSVTTKYTVKMCVEEAAIIVSSDEEPYTVCTITLTSPVMRDENQLIPLPENERSKPDPPDVLDRQKCLDALAALRHAKWFQAKAAHLQVCVVIIRILRDLCQRVPTWTPLNQWAMELLVEKCVMSGGANISPGDALRRIFECISSGMLLPGSPGLMDPCEKEPIDAAALLSNQEREDITASAQHALRLIAFRQVYKVLGMDQLPVQKGPGRAGNLPRKRKATEGAEETEDGDVTSDGKKDKKEPVEKT